MEKKHTLQLLYLGSIKCIIMGCEMHLPAVDNCLLPSLCIQQGSRINLLWYVFYYMKERFSLSLTHTQYRPCPTVYFLTHISLKGYTLCRQVGCKHIVFLFCCILLQPAHEKQENKRRAGRHAANILQIWLNFEKNHSFQLMWKAKAKSDFSIPVTSCLHPEQMSHKRKCHK